MRKIILAAAFVVFACFTTGALANDAAVVNTMKMRAWYQRDVDNIFLIFGDRIGVSKICSQAAISNYVEDQWAEIAKSSGCANDEALCSHDPKELARLAAEIKKAGGDINNEHDRRAAFKTKNVWYMAAAMYKLLRTLQYALDPDDSANSFSVVHISPGVERNAPPVAPQEKQQALDQLHQYIGACGTLKPVAWTIPGNVLPDDDRLTGISVRVSLLTLLTGYFVAQQLPAEEKGYIGCVNVWNEAERSRNQCKEKSCADDVPADDKSALMAKLDELKAHQCDLTYALQMIPVTDTAQPVKP